MSFGNYQLHYFNSWKLDETLENLRKGTRVNSGQGAAAAAAQATSRFDLSRNCVTSLINYVSGKFKREREANGAAPARSDLTEDLMQVIYFLGLYIINSSHYQNILVL